MQRGKSDDESGCQRLTEKECGLIDAMREPDIFYAGLPTMKKFAYKLWEANPNTRLFAFVFSDCLVNAPSLRFKVTTAPGENRFSLLWG